MCNCIFEVIHLALPFGLSQLAPFLVTTIFILYLCKCIYISLFFSICHMSTELSEINLVLSCLDKPMVITEPAVPNSWLLLWVQNCILATCSTCSTKISLHSYSIFSWVCQNWAIERKALLAGWFFGSFYFKFPIVDLLMILTVFHVTLCANTKAGKVSALAAGSM